jgi:hypothetical protein
MTIMVEGSTGAKCCGELRDIYCRMGKLKGLVDAMHDGLLEGRHPDFAAVEGIYLMMHETYDELERYILPIVGPDSVFRTSDDQTPVCPVS